MVKTTIALIIVTLALFFATAIAEIGGGYLIWSWIRKKKTLILGLVGGVILFIYGIIPTLQPSNFGRVYDLWWNIHSFLYSLGSIDRQKEARQI